MRTAALFVGSVVGAGFATGQEVRLFFGGDGVWSLVVASLFMAVCAFSFLSMGARGRELDARVTLGIDAVVSVSSFAVYAAMIAASEELLFAFTGVRGLSLLLAVAVSVLASGRIGWLSGLNLVAVPLMAVVIVWVGVRVGQVQTGAFHPVRALAYGGMNLLFSGALMIEEGGRLTFPERVTASVTAGIVTFLLLFFMWKCVCGTGTSSMPFLEAATRENLGTLASLALLLAIVTTMAGCAYLLIGRLTALTRDATLSVTLTTLLGYLLSLLGFAPIVTYTYPTVSALGLIATVAVVGGSVVEYLITGKKKRRIVAP